jgi:hypothetical protein
MPEAGPPFPDAAVSATFPLKLSPGHRYLVGQNGAPFLLHGDAGWSITVQLTREEADMYFEDRRQRGVNLVVVNLLEHKTGTTAQANRYMDLPFTTAGDFATPNEAYFAHVDWLFSKAAEKGIAILIAMAYLGYNGGDEGWYQVMVANGADKLRGYGRYVGDRWKSVPNLVWLDGGDYVPPASGIVLVNALAEGIKERDPGHLHAVHWNQETSGADVAVSGWLDLGTTYTYNPVYLKALKDYDRTDGRPFFLVESIYENEHASTPRSLRGQAYYALLSGAMGQIFGNNPVWNFAAGWQTALGSAGAVSMGYLHTLFAGLAWTTLVPDQTNAMLVAGQGTSGSADYAVLSRGSDGKLAILYLPTVRQVTVDLTKMTGPVRARWFDPTSGRVTLAPGSPFSAAGQTKFQPVGPNGAGDSDWVLVLDTSP